MVEPVADAGTVVLTVVGGADDVFVTGGLFVVVLSVELPHAVSARAAATPAIAAKGLT